MARTNPIDQELIHSKSEIQFTKIAEAAEYRKTLAKESDRAQHHYTTAHQLYTQLGAAKDLEHIQQEWQNPT
ncbi:hypothetical protein [Spirulina major]|uniref:hypothetical protein n=1 Tax=Spirulina major TaxID=270636 RepID=UPI0009330E25|nr:hypothetical protein [Spirulina major]